MSNELPIEFIIKGEKGYQVFVTLVIMLLKKSRKPLLLTFDEGAQVVGLPFLKDKFFLRDRFYGCLAHRLTNAIAVDWWT